MACIQLSRGLIILLTSSFIILSTAQLIIQQTQLIPWPRYPSIVAILLDLVLLIGLIASLTQHLKTLIFFSWLVALTFLLIFFGNAVSSHYKSDLLGTYDWMGCSFWQSFRKCIEALLCIAITVYYMKGSSRVSTMLKRVVSLADWENPFAFVAILHCCS